MNARTLSKDGDTKVVDLNRRKAIHEKCLNCVGWESHEVKECDFHDDCPLHPFRTGSGKQDATARAEAIRQYCLWCMCGQRGEVSQCPSTTCPLHTFRKTVIDHTSDSGNLPENHDIAHSSEHQSEGAMQSSPPRLARQKRRISGK
jgi:hypothetical protein